MLETPKNLPLRLHCDLTLRLGGKLDRHCDMLCRPYQRWLCGKLDRHCNMLCISDGKLDIHCDMLCISRGKLARHCDMLCISGRVRGSHATMGRMGAASQQRRADWLRRVS